MKAAVMNTGLIITFRIICISELVNGFSDLHKRYIFVDSGKYTTFDFLISYICRDLSIDKMSLDRVNDSSDGYDSLFRKRTKRDEVGDF